MATNMIQRTTRMALCSIMLTSIMATIPLSSAIAGPWHHHGGFNPVYGYNDFDYDDYDYDDYDYDDEYDEYYQSYTPWQHNSSSFSFNFTQRSAPQPAYAPYQAPSNHYNNYAQTSYNRPQTEGRYCREYIRPASVAGRTQQTYGTACLQPDGDWQIVD
jgi:hypothetical protein